MPSSYTAAIATMSWIDPKTGLPETDKGAEPPAKVTREDIKGGKLYRFSNFLEGTVFLDSSGRISRAAFTDDSGMYRGPSFAGIESAPVGRIGRTVTTTHQEATFRQIVGCRTVSPEKIGAGAGAVVGGGVGVYAGAKVGAIGGAWAGPVGMFIGAVAVGTVGYFAGREVAEFVTAFPPIWTELEMKISADGSVKGSMVSHSLFPSNSFYFIENTRVDGAGGEKYKRVVTYDGDNTRLKSWKEKGWGGAASAGARSGPTAGNPWGMTDPSNELGGGSITHETPVSY